MADIKRKRRWVTLLKAAEETGYSINALRGKVREGVWPEGVVWIKAPDNRIMVDMEAYQAWVEGNIHAA